MANLEKIIVKNQEIRVLNKNNESYISLTDMIKSKDGDFFISDWLRNRNTIEFLGIWESVHNQNFNYGEFAIIKSKVGLNNYKLSAKEWTEKTGAIGIISSTGRYGGTFAIEDIALEFGMWISAEFKIYLVKEFRRLKNEEIKRQNLDWDLQRTISKINYKIHTDSIQNNLIPHTLSKDEISKIYANEADVLNMALFGITAKQWRDKNKNFKGNIRDYASIEQLVILSNLESLNAVLIEQKINQKERLKKLNEVAIIQMKSLIENKFIKRLKDRN